ncbi:hypothetical protein TKK_0016484 [Trichogramma kaykai]
MVRHETRKEPIGKNMDCHLANGLNKLKINMKKENCKVQVVECDPKSNDITHTNCGSSMNRKNKSTIGYTNGKLEFFERDEDVPFKNKKIAIVKPFQQGQ